MEHSRLGRVETGPPARVLPIGTQKNTDTHRRAALRPSPENQKQAAFGMTSCE
jgi:hypothetical protein